MAASSHFGWPKITFDRISRHFRSIRYFDFFSQNGCRRRFCMTDNHFWSHFSPFKINTQVFIFYTKWLPAAILVTENTFDHISRHFRSILNFFLILFFKMAAGGHFGSPICAKNNRVLPLCVVNGYAKYEVDLWIYDTVRDATSFLSIFIQNGRQRPFCFSDWWQKS